jgi:hypothetical protein
MTEPGPLKVPDVPFNVPVTLSNASDAPLSGTLKIGVIDDWRVTKFTRDWTLAPRATTTLQVQITPGRATLNALYPVHAWADFRLNEVPQQAHAILIVPAQSTLPASAATNSPLLKAAPRGALALTGPQSYRVSYAVRDGEVQSLPVGWSGAEATTGTYASVQEIERGERRWALSVHAPWRTGWGTAMFDYRVQMPQAKPIVLDFATAIRDHNPQTEAGSDGVEFQVQVDSGNGFQTLWRRFSDARRWESARVDLSAFAGKTITLRLLSGPGPQNNTSSDQAYWAEPVLLTGPPPAPESASYRGQRRQRALNLASAALQSKTQAWSWQLKSTALNGALGAAVVPGPNGLADAFIAFVDARRSLVFEGFAIEVSGQKLGAARSNLAAPKVLSTVLNGRATLQHEVLWEGRALKVQAQLWAQSGALRIAFAMPGVQRDRRGHPRFSRLAVGAASHNARRVYAGLGNVMQNPVKFTLGAGGFNLSTRHVGFDFSNGLSLVQATDIFPDALEVDASVKRYTLVAHHDTTFSFLPSTRGAFAAARAYRRIVNFRPAAGVNRLLGKMCLDQWGGDYRGAAEDLEKAARYGLTDAVFVKHVWQRWGYDYRLPEIYPPEGNRQEFMAMVNAAKRGDILFCPHDNYIDFYPDAKGFSYDHIIFNEDGTPQEAWFNEGRKAQSYRWLPTAFEPWLRDNLKQIKQGFAPDSYFVDVFTAIPPIDFYDRSGRFYAKPLTTRQWGRAFDIIRNMLGNNAPTLSEAGHDALIGHLDGAQSDHSSWVPKGAPRGKGNDAYFRWEIEAQDGERVPWHDMASHGSFVLLAGGLGNRYAAGLSTEMHGYGSDDYLGLTVLGGRNPMSDGPFNRRAVMTYWLLHDLSAQLAKSEMVSHNFSNDDIHRQVVRFQNKKGQAVVRVNRGRADWKIGDETLPRYGFVARVGKVQAKVTRRDGVISAMSQAPGVLFVDARPPVSAASVRPRVMGVEVEGRQLRVRVDWDVRRPIASSYRPFMHFVNEKNEQGEGIAFQGGSNLEMSQFNRAGLVQSTFEATLPADVQLPATFAIRFGLYDPQSGGRLPLLGPTENGRARGGMLQIEANGKATLLPEAPDAGELAMQERLNTAGKIVDFGVAQTNGAFRLQHSGNQWQLTPLPDSEAFDVRLQLAKLGAAGREVLSVVLVLQNGETSEKVPFVQEGALLGFQTAPDVFAYRIGFAPRS